MKQYILIILAILFSPVLRGQTVENVTGKISFISSQNIYVKFTSTEGIKQGDTLYIIKDNNLIPALKVNTLSSTSCVCAVLTSENLPVEHLIIAKKQITKSQTIEKPAEVVVAQAPEKALQDSSIKSHPGYVGRKQRISGSISANSYSDFSNTSAANSTRFRYTFSIDAKNIGDSRFSAESYISFRYKKGDWAEVKNNIFNALKIYSLALRYDPDKTMQISLGRRINPRISSLGSVDGLQIEKTFNKFSIGAIAGSRPDYTDYGFNFNLLQAGGYVALNTSSAKSYTETSLAFMQQMNNGKTDRRFLYFQHSNTLIRNISVLSTFEVDLYKLVNDTPQSTFDLTGLYFSLRYRMTKAISLTGSYDSRKNVMYYESYKTYIDQVLENEMRQSYRLQANVRITNNITFGIQGSYRFLKSDAHTSKNFNSYFTFSQIPGLNMNATISGTYLETSYIKGEILGLSLSKDMFNGKFQSGLGYRYVDYKLPESNLGVKQNIAEINLTYMASRSLFLSMNYEGTFEKQDKYNRLYLQMRIRF
jgi:hypothetical protein